MKKYLFDDDREFTMLRKSGVKVLKEISEHGQGDRDISVSFNLNPAAFLVFYKIIINHPEINDELAVVLRKEMKDLKRDLKWREEQCDNKYKEAAGRSIYYKKIREAIEETVKEENEQEEESKKGGKK